VKPDPAIAAARAEVERSRARLMNSAHALQDRLSPRTLARGAWDGAKEKGAELAEDAVDAVRSRPIAATGVVAAIVTFLAREPLMDLAGQLASAVGGKRKERKKSKTKAKIKARTKDMEAAQ
jgi:hypothetical protein